MSSPANGVDEARRRWGKKKGEKEKEEKKGRPLRLGKEWFRG